MRTNGNRAPFRMLRKQPAERPSSSEVLSFLNAQSGFPTATSMPHAIIKRPSGTAMPLLPEGETLSRATGQGGRQRVARLSIAVSLLVGVLLVGGLLARRFVLQKPDGSAVTPRSVHLRITSTPSNAEVIRESDKQPLGRTPYVVDQPAATGSETLILRHAGYVEHPVTIDRSASRELALSLTPIPAPPPPATPAPAAVSEKSGARTKPVSSGPPKRRKPGKVTNADIDFIK